MEGFEDMPSPCEEVIHYLEDRKSWEEMNDAVKIHLRHWVDMHKLMVGLEDNESPELIEFNRACLDCFRMLVYTLTSARYLFIGTYFILWT